MDLPTPESSLLINSPFKVDTGIQGMSNSLFTMNSAKKSFKSKIINTLELDDEYLNFYIKTLKHKLEMIEKEYNFISEQYNLKHKNLEEELEFFETQLKPKET